MNLRLSLVKLISEDIGQRETHGKNRSPLIDEINQKLFIPLGSPYCLSGLMVRGIIRLCDMYELKIPFKRYASTQKFWQDVPLKYKKEIGQMADIGIMRDVINPNLGHAFILSDNCVDKKMKTIEYNSNPAGSRDGDGVYRSNRFTSGTRTQAFLGCVDVIQWIEDENK